MSDKPNDTSHKQPAKKMQGTGKKGEVREYQGYSDEQREEAFARWVGGQKYSRIAEAMDIPRGTVQRWHADLGWAKRLALIREESQQLGTLGIISAGNAMLKTTLEGAPVVHKQQWDVLRDPVSSQAAKAIAVKILRDLADTIRLFVPEISTDRPSLSSETVNPGLLRPPDAD